MTTNKPKGWTRSVLWMKQVEHDSLVACAKSINTSKSKLARAGIRREIARLIKLQK